MFESNTDSWKDLYKSIQRRVDVVQAKCVMMVSFVVCVCRIFCSDQGRDIVSFLTKNWMTGNKYIHW